MNEELKAFQERFNPVEFYKESVKLLDSTDNSKFCIEELLGGDIELSKYMQQYEELIYKPLIKYYQQLQGKV